MGQAVRGRRGLRRGPGAPTAETDDRRDLAVVDFGSETASLEFRECGGERLTSPGSTARAPRDERPNRLWSGRSSLSERHSAAREEVDATEVCVVSLSGATPTASLADPGSWVQGAPGRRRWRGGVTRSGVGRSDDGQRTNGAASGAVEHGRRSRTGRDACRAEGDRGSGAHAVAS